MKLIHFITTVALVAATSTTTTAQSPEAHRPLVHFSPKAHWMNDPNGMVFVNGVYHLFYQYNPNASVWGPMHWGHATSKDLIAWTHEPIALYPDSLGTIFSGSAVYDKNLTSGFGSKAAPPIVAIFTHHDAAGEKAGRNDFQNQSLGYSIDNGKTWKKYEGNPVLRNPGIRDFRDPKVMWYEPAKTWIMTLAVDDRLHFYSSPDLKAWTKESEFGQKAGAHGGVWECPDLFTLPYAGRMVWVLVVNINPGGPNQGSATQYFLGQFDGKTFTPDHSDTRWLDYGPDEYAGITWSNTGKRKIFLGWMSNWIYANEVPTETWRNATTIPRELSLRKVGNDLLIASKPVGELDKYMQPGVRTGSKILTQPYRVTTNGKAGMAVFSMKKLREFTVTLSNTAGEKLVIGYNPRTKKYYIDRTKAGESAFKKEFAAIHTAPRFSTSPEMDLKLLIDVSSVELFADGGLTTMTEIFFPSTPYSIITIESTEGAVLNGFEYRELKSVL